MSEKPNGTVANRRDVLRSGAAVGGGILASVIPGIAATDHGQTTVVGYVSRTSYRKIVGTDDVEIGRASCRERV